MDQDQAFFSPSTMGWYLDSIHGDERPSDCVPVPWAQYKDLIGSGRPLEMGVDGVPSPVSGATAVSVPPQQVTPLQAKGALLEFGYLQAVTDYVYAPGTDEFVRLAWEEAQVFRRDSLMVMAVAIQLQLDDAQLDALFTRAAQIVV